MLVSKNISPKLQRDIEVAVATVNIGQGSEKSIVVVYIAGTHIDKHANH